MENANIQKIKCDILSYFQTMCARFLENWGIFASKNTMCQLIWPWNASIGRNQSMQFQSPFALRISSRGLGLWRLPLSGIKATTPPWHSTRSCARSSLTHEFQAKVRCCIIPDLTSWHIFQLSFSQTLLSVAYPVLPPFLTVRRTHLQDMKLWSLSKKEEKRWNYYYLFPFCALT